MDRVITARLLLASEGQVEFPVIRIDGAGNIISIESDPSSLSTKSDVLAPGYFDIHNHGGIGIDLMSATVAEMHLLQRFLAENGVAHYLPTTVTAPIDFTLRSLERFADVIESGAVDCEATPAGIHIEGPFLSHAKRGMHPAEHLQAPSIELFEKLYTAARGHIRLMTIAPEVGGGDHASAESSIELIRYATERGVRCSIGHSNALMSEALAAIEAGAVSATHTFNAMRPLDHREPGILGVVLDDARVYADLICDGIHVAPELVSLWFRLKGRDRAILITDALAATGMPDGEYVVGTSPVTISGEHALVTEDLKHGKKTLAGSVLTLDRAVTRFRKFTGSSLADATRLASYNPAAMVGLPGLTRLAAGSPATLNRFDSEGNLLSSYVRGREVERHRTSLGA